MNYKQEPASVSIEDRRWRGMSNLTPDAPTSKGRAEDLKKGKTNQEQTINRDAKSSKEDLSSVIELEKRFKEFQRNNKAGKEGRR